MSDRTIPFPSGAGNMNSSAGGARTFFRTGPGSAVRAITLPESGVRTRVPGASLSRAVAIARAVERNAPREATCVPAAVPPGDILPLKPLAVRRYGAGLHLVTRDRSTTMARFRLPSHLRALAGRLQQRVRG